MAVVRPAEFIILRFTHKMLQAINTFLILMMVRKGSKQSTAINKSLQLSTKVW
ncbi:MAG: hypothetical protein ACR2KX_07985 [Chitinophagaceae bacterium]